MNELEALVCLTAIPHLGPVRGKLLLERFGSALAALQASEQEIAELPGFGTKLIQSWRSRFQTDHWQKSLLLAQREAVQLVAWGSPDYPAQLKELPDAPLLLYIKGRWQPYHERSIAIVGTRHASRYGLEMAFRLAEELAAAGWCVVSGLARGIDSAAHRGALRSGCTIAVIGSGLADLYPPENKQLANEIICQGALISEFAMQQPPDRGQFPQRNRIVSALTQATLLIEAPLNSGAMLTMEKAKMQGRPCFALPGRADVETFRGNHALIREGRAKLVETSAHLLQALGAPRAPTSQKPLQLQLPLLSEEELNLLSYFSESETTLEELIGRAQLPVQKLQVLIMSLILKKIVQEYPGKVYKSLYVGSRPKVNSPETSCGH